MIRETPALKLSKPFFFSGWMGKNHWIQVEVHGLSSNTQYVLFNGTKWSPIQRAFLYDENGLITPLELKSSPNFFIIPSGKNSSVFLLEIKGHPLIITPKIMEMENFISQQIIIFTFAGIIGGIVLALLVWYFLWAVRTQNLKRLWKAINFVLLAILTALIISPGEHSIPLLLSIMAVFGVSWTLYQLLTHQELHRPDMIALHSILIFLLFTMVIVGWRNDSLGFFLFGISLHFQLILLIFYHQASTHRNFLPWHVFFALTGIGFFWEMMGLWTPFSPIFPWLMAIGLLAYLARECWEFAQEIYFDRSLYQFYQNTNRLLKSHLAQSNKKLQETVHKLQKETAQKSELARLYENQQRQYQELVDNLSDWIWEMDARLKITYTSPRIESFFNLSADNVLHKPIEYIVGKEATLYFKQALNQSKGMLSGHLLAISREKKSLLLEVATTPLIRNNQIEGYRCIARDVSQLVAMRNDLSSYQQSIQILFNETPFPMAILNLQTLEFSNWNSQFEKLIPFHEGLFSEFLEKVDAAYSKDLYFLLKQQENQQEVSFCSFSVPLRQAQNIVWFTLQCYRVIVKNTPYAVMYLIPFQEASFTSPWVWLESSPLPVLLVERSGKIILKNTVASQQPFHPSLPLPIKQNSLLTLETGERIAIISYDSFLSIVIGLGKENTETYKRFYQILTGFPIPWVVVNHEGNVLEWHPKIFDVFRFQAHQSIFLSQMIKESGLVRHLLFPSPTPFKFKKVQAYFHNKKDEVFEKEVLLFFLNNEAMLFFFDVQASQQEKESLWLFLQRLSVFSHSLKEFFAELQELETKPPVLQIREASPSVDLSALTETEKRVFTLIVDGKSNAEIAQHLAITEETVKGHIKRIFKKLGVQKRYQLIQRFHGKLLP
ncbi:LuxR C-terminal-related transcriptional regulator [Thermospira aquatica]|uniref:PAS domain-containing protein n=1 Tax=Thermospira aquatica TaxID=2828656 RepID=A0AAX3BG34_9SPIR|nr:LuxR C-terminal-related transcriptional regulator [Thermospira aquatica]URA11254.1 PAS domain-containing protein [Thermospira aquatica]